MLSLKKLIFLIGVGFFITSTSGLSAQPDFFLNFKENGEVSHKIFYKQQAIRLLKSDDLVEQKLGSDLLVMISTLPTSSDHFVQDITLLINFNKKNPLPDWD